LFHIYWLFATAKYIAYYYERNGFALIDVLLLLTSRRETTRQ